MVKTVETTSERLASDLLLRSAASVLQQITALQTVLFINTIAPEIDSPISQSLLDATRFAPRAILTAGASRFINAITYHANLARAQIAEIEATKSPAFDLSQYELPTPIRDADIIKKLTAYLEGQGRDPALIDVIDMGICRSLAFLWAHACLTDAVRDPKSGSPANDLDWFWQSIKTIVACDPEVLEAGDLDKATSDIFEEFISHSMLLQRPDVSMQIPQADTYRLYQLASEEALDKEYEYYLPTSREKFALQLKTILKNKQKIIMLGLPEATIDHAAAIYRDDSYIYLFDLQLVIPQKWRIDDPDNANTIEAITTHLYDRYCGKRKSPEPPNISIVALGRKPAGTYPVNELEFFRQNESLGYKLLILGYDLLFQQLAGTEGRIKAFKELDREIKKGLALDCAALETKAIDSGLTRCTLLALGFRYCNAEILDAILNVHYPNFEDPDQPQHHLDIEVFMQGAIRSHVPPEFVIERWGKIPRSKIITLCHLAMGSGEKGKRLFSKAIAELNVDERYQLLLELLRTEKYDYAELIAEHHDNKLSWLSDAALRAFLENTLQNENPGEFEFIWFSISNQDEFLTELLLLGYDLSSSLLLDTLALAVARKHQTISKFFVDQLNLGEFREALFEYFDAETLAAILAALSKSGLDWRATPNNDNSMLDKLIKRKIPLGNIIKSAPELLNENYRGNETLLVFLIKEDSVGSGDFEWLRQPLLDPLLKAFNNDAAAVFEFALSTTADKQKFFDTLITKSYPIKINHIFDALKIAVAKNHVAVIEFFVALINQRDPDNDSQMKTDFVQQLFSHYRGKESQGILISLSEHGLQWAAQPNHDNSMLSKLFASTLTTRSVAKLLKQPSLKNPEINEWLRRHQPTKQPPRSLRRLRRPRRRRKLSAAKPRRLEHLRHELPEGISDARLIVKIVKYLKDKKRDQKIIELIDRGLCIGLAFIWAHACHASYLNVKKSEDNPHDLKWFWQSIATIADPDSNPENLDAKTAAVFDEFVAHTNYFQKPTLLGINQADTERLYRLASDGPLTQEYQYEQPSSEERLGQQLDIILQNKHKIIMLGVPDHSIAIYRNSTHILLFDSHDIIPTKWSLEKAGEMIAAHVWNMYCKNTYNRIAINCFGTEKPGTYPEIDTSYYYQKNSDKLNALAYDHLIKGQDFLFKQLLQKSDAVELFNALNLQINQGKLEDIKILIKEADAIGLNPEVALALGFRYMNAEVIDWVLQEYFGDLLEARIEASQPGRDVVSRASFMPHIDPDFVIERLQKLPNCTMTKLANFILLNCSIESTEALIKHWNPEELNLLVLQAMKLRRWNKVILIADRTGNDLPWLSHPDFKNYLDRSLQENELYSFECILATVANKQDFLTELHRNHYKIGTNTLLSTLEIAAEDNHDSVIEFFVEHVKQSPNFCEQLFDFPDETLERILLALSKHGLDWEASGILAYLIKKDRQLTCDLPWLNTHLLNPLWNSLNNNDAPVFEFALANVTNKGEFLNRLLAGEYPLKASNILGALKVAVEKNHVAVIKFFADRINHRDPEKDHEEEKEFIKAIFTDENYENIITALTKNGLDLDAHPHDDSNIIEKAQMRRI